jgi:lipopolysaccharide export system permease protein
MIGFTLGRYLAARFFTTIMAVFITIFGLVYLVDFVEMLRRAGDKPGVGAGFIAFLSFLRTPTVSEQVLPFCVLFGAMTAFLNLTRKLELIVARAAGVSVWQFILPPVAIAILIGLVSVTLLNPLSALMKQRADQIELDLFGGSARHGTDTTVWLRQKSVDGASMMRVDEQSDNGAFLRGVTAYIYDTDGNFVEKVEAESGAYRPGYWQLTNARIAVPGEELLQTHDYLLATNLSADELTPGTGSPEAVPFWSLPTVRDQTEMAGLDGTGYRLHYQTLLARPLLLVAMVLIAAAFSLRFFRFGGIGKMVVGGIGAGFLLYLLTKVVADLGGSGLLSAPVAAWSPAIVGSMLGALALLNQEDG